MDAQPPFLDRRLRAFWFADIVGFTSLSSRNAAEALRAVEALRTAAGEEVDRAGGRVVNVSGDAVLAEFGSSDQALRSAILLRNVLAGRVELHFGVHLGEVSTRHGDIYGDGVNVAARLQAHASAGQILASEDIFRQVRANPEFRFEPLGGLSLKGVPFPVVAYRVGVAADEDADVASRHEGLRVGASPVAVGQYSSGAPTGLAPRPSEPTVQALPVATAPRRANRLIVTPFRLLRPDDETQFLAFSLADAVSFSLSNLEAIVVRSSHLAGADPVSQVMDPREVARRTDVDLVVAGTLLRVKDRIQVTAELSDGQEGTRLASFRAQAAIHDLFELQEEMTRRIVEALAIPLSVREQERMRHDVPATPLAYELYLRANEVNFQRGDWDSARDLYRAALVEDPRYAPAWAQLGRCDRLLAKYGAAEVRVQGFRDAEAALATALALNPELELAHGYQALVETELGRSGSAMLRLVTRLQGRPRGVELLSGLVQAFRYCGLVEESLAADRAARAIDPAARTSVAYTLFLRGDFEEASRAGTRSDAYVRAAAALVVDPEHTESAREALREHGASMGPDFGPYVNSLVYVAEGRDAEAVDVGRRAYTDFPDPEGRYFFARILARLGKGEDALALMEGIQDEYAAFPLPGVDPWLQSIEATERYGRILDEAARRRDRYRGEATALGWGPANVIDTGR